METLITKTYEAHKWNYVLYKVFQKTLPEQPMPAIRKSLLGDLPSLAQLPKEVVKKTTKNFHIPYMFSLRQNLKEFGNKRVAQNGSLQANVPISSVS